MIKLEHCWLWTTSKCCRGFVNLASICILFVLWFLSDCPDGHAYAITEVINAPYLQLHTSIIYWWFMLYNYGHKTTLSHSMSITNWHTITHNKTILRFLEYQYSRPKVTKCYLVMQSAIFHGQLYLTSLHMIKYGWLLDIISDGPSCWGTMLHH